MAKELMKVEGFKELEQALKDLPKATGRNCIRRALTKAAEPIVQTASTLAPSRPGSGALKRSIAVSKIRFSKGEAGKQAFAEAMRRGASRKEAAAAAHEANAEQSEDVTSGIAEIGPTREGWYGGLVEFGTRHSVAKPFLRPAWEQGKRTAAESIRDILKEEIDKAVARIARKQAKLIAQVEAGK